MIVSIRFNDEEMRQLEQEAKSFGLTSVQPLVKGKALGDADEFFRNWKHLLEKVMSLPSNSTFSIKLLFGIAWIPISRGIKLSLGRSFYAAVDGGLIAGVQAVGVDASNTMFYKKI